LSTSNQRRKRRQFVIKAHEKASRQALLDMQPEETTWKIVNNILRFGPRYVGDTIMYKPEAMSIKWALIFEQHSKNPYPKK
jgi:hypothetical protein